MKSIIELELELSQAKLDKMTSTVKQLGTKLKKANENNETLNMELEHYKSRLKAIDGAICRNFITIDEAHGRALNDNRGFDLRAMLFDSRKDK